VLFDSTQRISTEFTVHFIWSAEEWLLRSVARSKGLLTSRSKTMQRIDNANLLVHVYACSIRLLGFESCDCWLEGCYQAFILHQEEIVWCTALSQPLTNPSNVTLILSNDTCLGLCSFRDVFFKQTTSSWFEYTASTVGLLSDLYTFTSHSLRDIILISIYAYLVCIILTWARIHVRQLSSSSSWIRRLLQMSVREALLSRAKSSDIWLPVLEGMLSCILVVLVGRCVLTRAWHLSPREE